jgi:hypothetical protein
MSMLCTSHAVDLAAGRRVVARDGGSDAYIVRPGGLRFIGQMSQPAGATPLWRENLGS